VPAEANAARTAKNVKENKLQVLSDLHLEFQADGGRALLAQQRGWDKSASAVVLAGDIGSAGRHQEELAEGLAFFADRVEQVFFVPGNHEYYGCHAPETVEALRALAASVPRVTLLEPGVIAAWGGRRVLGATLWFKDGPHNEELAREMSDFRAIKGFVRWVYRQNRGHVAWLERTVQEGDIVVTHHLPSWRSVAPQFLSDPLNAFFLCDMEQLILARQPLWWIHGHTHEPCTYELGRTRVVANPRGYPAEARPDYAPMTLSDAIAAEAAIGSDPNHHFK
jgi:predicted phosphodiesterase